MSILALDIGDKRVGAALSQGRLARPIGWFERGRGVAERQIVELVAKEKVTQVIVGIPLNADNTLGPQARKCVRFARRLQRRVTAAFIFVDEFSSTCEASGLEGIAQGGEKGVLDARSASILLQSFLDGKTVPIGEHVLNQEVDQSI